MRISPRANQDWRTPADGFRWEHVIVEVLMDIRDELQKLNATIDATLACPAVQRIPTALGMIAIHTNRIRPRTKKKGTAK